MNKFLIAVPLLISSFSFSQSNIKCNIEIVKNAYNNADVITGQICLDFLMTIDSVCSNNSAFSEFSNVTLYKILDNNPNVLIRTIEENISIIRLDLVILMIKNPVNDSIDLNTIKSEIQKLDSKSKIKFEIIHSINLALDKYKK